MAQLPEVVVIAKRETNAYLASVQLPEIVVVAKRVASMVAKEDRGTQLPSPAISAGF
jgi:hypothetical protein